jgi:hypothetical protein
MHLLTLHTDFLQDVPASIAKIMDTTTADAAPTLNAQLDRKITIVNFWADARLRE